MGVSGSVSVSGSVVSTIEFEGHISGDFQIMKVCTTRSYSMLWLCHQGGFDAHLFNTSLINAQVLSA